MLNAKIASPLALAVLLALAGCSKKEPAADAAKATEAPAAAAPAAEPHPMPAAAPTDIDLTGIAKAEGGKTIAEIYGEKDALAGTTVVVRGKVVKANPDIMGKNWLHLRDGSGEDGNADLTVTTTAALPQVGDTVVASGTVAVGQDFGMGYEYDVILENAELKAE